MQRPNKKRAPYVVLGATCLVLAIGSRPAFGQSETEQKVDETTTTEETKVEETTTTETTTTETTPTETAPTETVPADQAATPPAAAETPPATDPEKAGDVEELYITGSRIKRIDLTTPAPVTVLTRQDLDASGRQSIGEILQNLPAQSNAINIQVNNGGDGATRINLRGIGTPRTLVLVNGRRFVSGGTGADSSVDLNSIPSDVIERVEVLKDGASAIYGSDAVAGVVNIITKKSFSGLELDTYMGGTSNGGFVYSLGATAGERAEKGGFLLSFQWYDQSDILAGQREFSKSDLDFDYYAALHPGEDADMDGMPDVPNPTVTQGSSSIPEGYFRDRGEGPGNETWQRLKMANNNVPTYTKDPADGFRPFRATGNRDSGDGDFYNYQPENYLVTPSKRISLWGHGDYELSKRAAAYFEAGYTNRRSEQLLAPEPLFTANEGVAVTADNVYNPFGRDFVDVRRRLVEFGNRLFKQEVSTYRAVLGLNGSFTDDGFFSSWNWDANFIYGRTDGIDTKRGSLVRHKLASAIGPSYFDETGTAICGTPDNPVAEACTPLNLFGGPGSITGPQAAGLTYTGIANGFSMQRMVNVSASGSLFELWKRPVGIAVGYGFRREDGAYTPDPITAAGDTTGNKGEPTGGGYSENAVFGELDIPVLADLPAVQLLEAQVAVRGYNFTTFGGGATYKLGGRWQVFEHLAVRGTFSTAFRAPSIAELYAGQADSFPDAIDPCSTFDRTRTADQERNCTADGLPTALDDDRAQLMERVGGNPEVQPEKANIFTAGLVVTPKGGKFIDGLSLTLDYFSIKVTNAISVKSAEVILNNCYSFAQRSDCDLIRRDAQGFVDTIIDLNTNVGGLTTTGVDFGIVYSLPTDMGTFRLNFDGVLLGKFDDIQATRTVNAKDVYDLNEVHPSLRFNAGIGWGWEGITAGFVTRYTSSLTECELNDCSQEARDAFKKMADEALAMDPTFTDTIFHERKVSAHAVADLYAGYSFSSSFGFTAIQAGINNLFNSPPPRIFNGFLANSDAENYDFLGRYFYVGLKHSL